MFGRISSLSLVLLLGACTTTSSQPSLFDSVFKAGEIQLVWSDNAPYSGKALVSLTNVSTAEFCTYRDYQSNVGSQLVAAQFRHRDGALSNDVNAGYLVPQDLTKVIIKPGMSFRFEHNFRHVLARRSSNGGNPIMVMRFSMTIVPCGPSTWDREISAISPWFELPRQP
jgi:hypothetical protein